MRRTFAVLPMLLLLFACAAPQQAPAPQYSSAEHKLFAEFLLAYQAAWNGRDEKAILRLYAKNAREAPLLFLGNRVLSRPSLEQNLAFILKEQALAGLRQETLAPIEFQISGDTAEVKAVVRITYAKDGETRSGYLRRTYLLARSHYFWKLERSHFEFIPAGPLTEGLVPL
jgi:ketosteroid isomerase-like protein